MDYKLPPPPRNFENRTLYHRDNLSVLRGMNSQTVDLIATDPPFNKGKDFHATPESLAAGAKFQDRWSWEKDVHEEWVDQISDDWPSVERVISGSRSSWGDDMGAFLCFMAVRLIEMRRVLKETGSIYLHCDPTASHYLKQLMDAVFGRRLFRNEIIWKYGLGGSSKRLWSKKHDVILFYSRSKRYCFDKPTIPATSQRMKGQRKGMLDVWCDIPSLNNKAKERVGYPTQKPLDLYKRIIKASSKKGDLVLDPFAGCATTCVAAEREQRQWVGIDIWQKAHQVVLDRMKDEGMIAPDGSRQTGRLLTIGEVLYSTEPPERTDDKMEATPFLQVREKVRGPAGPKYSRNQMYEILISERGIRCAGCDREFDDPRYLELDHQTPRADGGTNHITNRILLCSPCNRAKKHLLTLSGLRELNKKKGWMASYGS